MSGAFDSGFDSGFDIETSSSSSSSSSASSLSSSSSSSSSFSSCSSSSSSSSDNLQRYWVGGALGAETDWHTATNWASVSGGAGGAGVPTASTDVIFDTNSNTYNCVATSSMSCKSFTTTSDWAALFSTAGYALTSVGSLTWDGTTNSDLRLETSTVTMSGDGNFHIGSGLTSISVSQAVIYLQGTGNWDIDKDARVLHLLCAYAGKTTTTTGSATIKGTQQVHIKGGTLTLTADLDIWATTDSPWDVDAGYTVNGTKALVVNVGVANLTEADWSGLTHGGSGATAGITINKTGMGSFNCTLLGALSAGYLNFNTTDTGFATYYLNDQNLTTTVGSLTFSRSVVYCGAGTITVATSVFVTNGASTFSQTILNMETSVWVVATDWTIATTGSYNPIVNAGTSQVTFSGTAASTITSLGTTSFYTLVINKSASVNVLQADALSCGSLSCSGSTKYSSATFALTSSSTLSFTGTGTLRLDTVTITGDGNFVMAATVGVTTLTACSLDLRGTGNLTLNKNSQSFVNITLAYPGKTTTWAGTSSLSGCSNIFTINGGALVVSPAMVDINLFPVTQSNPLVVVSGSTISIPDSASGLQLRPANTAPLTINIPAITITGAGEFDLLKTSTSTANVTYELAGAISTPWMQWGNTTNIAGTTLTINTNNYAITCTGGPGMGVLNNYNTRAVAIVNYNYGASVVSVGLFRTTGGQNVNLNLGTSQWTCTGDWTYQANTTITTGTSVINITNTSTVTANGKNFYHLILNADTKKVSMVGALAYTIYRLQIEPGTEMSVAAGLQLTITTYHHGDWDGSLGKNTIFSSLTPSSAWLLVAPNDVVPSYMTVSDSDASGGYDIVAWNGTNTNGGGNTNWFFTSVVTVLTKEQMNNIADTFGGFYLSTASGITPLKVGNQVIMLSTTPTDVALYCTSSEIMRCTELFRGIEAGTIIATYSPTNLTKRVVTNP